MILNQNGGTPLPTLSNPGSAADLRSGKQLLNGDGEIVTGSMATRTLPTPSISVNSSGTITATESLSSAGYYGTGSKSSSVKLSSAHDSDFKAANIKKGVTIFGVTGTYTESITVEHCRLSTTDGDIELNSTGTLMTIHLPKSCKQLLGLTGLLQNEASEEYVISYPYVSSSGSLYGEITFYRANGTHSIQSERGKFTISGSDIEIDISDFGTTMTELVCDFGLDTGQTVHVIYIPA